MIQWQNSPIKGTNHPQFPHSDPNFKSGEMSSLSHIRNFKFFFSNRFFFFIFEKYFTTTTTKNVPHNTLAHKRLLTFSCFELAARTEDEGGRGSMRAAEESHTDLLTRPFYARRPHWCVVSTVVETYQIPGYRAGPTGWLETGAGRNP